MLAIVISSCYHLLRPNERAKGQNEMNQVSSTTILDFDGDIITADQFALDNSDMDTLDFIDVLGDLEKYGKHVTNEMSPRIIKVVRY